MSAMFKFQQKPVIHVIEDNELFSFFLNFGIEQDGDYSLQRFVSAEDYLSSHTGKPNLLIIDHYLPGQSGMELIEQVLHVYPSLPFIVVSNQKNDEIKSAYLSKGASDYIEKSPDNFSQLTSSIDRVLHKRKQKKFLGLF